MNTALHQESQKRRELVKLATPYLDRAIEYIVEHPTLYSSDVSYLWNDIPRLSLGDNVAKTDAYYCRSTSTIYINDMIFEGMRHLKKNDDQRRTMRHTTYFISRNDRYTRGAMIRLEDYIMVVMIHELTHHIQKLRFDSNAFHIDYVHRIKRFNDKSYDTGNIQSYEAETTYNEVEYLLDNDERASSYVCSVKQDNNFLTEAFENSKLQILDCFVNDENCPKIDYDFEVDEFNDEDIVNISNGHAPRGISLEKIDIVLIRKSNKSNSCVLYIPSKQSMIETIRWRNRKINIRLFKLAENSLINKNKMSIDNTKINAILNLTCRNTGKTIENNELVVLHDWGRNASNQEIAVGKYSWCKHQRAFDLELDTDASRLLVENRLVVSISNYDKFRTSPRKLTEAERERISHLT